jgi:hypothetical protein
VGRGYVLALPKAEGSRRNRGWADSEEGGEFCGVRRFRRHTTVKQPPCRGNGSSLPRAWAICVRSVTQAKPREANEPSIALFIAIDPKGKPAFAHCLLERLTMVLVAHRYPIHHS